MIASGLNRRIPSLLGFSDPRAVISSSKLFSLQAIIILHVWFLPNVLENAFSYCSILREELKFQILATPKGSDHSCSSGVG